MPSHISTGEILLFYLRSLDIFSARRRGLKKSMVGYLKSLNLSEGSVELSYNEVSPEIFINC